MFERKPTRVKNYGVWLRYDSRTGTHNMYREYRDLSVCAAVTQCYRDMGARHRCTADRIQILKVNEIAAKECKRTNVTQFHVSDFGDTVRCVEGFRRGTSSYSL